MASQGGDQDEWDLLRATPDYDVEEMRGVGLCLPPSPPPAPVPPAPTAALNVPRTGTPQWDASSLAFAAPRGDRWPESGSVALMANDLLNAGEAGTRPVEPHSASWTEGYLLPESWVVLPDQVASEGGRDLLETALVVGERAGLLHGSAPCPVLHGTPPLVAAGSEAHEPRPTDAADLLDQALAAGHRAGLMERWS